MFATDASASQILHAAHGDGIAYSVAPADASGLPDRSVDAVTVAQAMHWLDVKSFYAEVRRVAREGAVLAFWGYGDPVIDDREIDGIVHAFNRGTIEEYWKPERQLLLDAYRDIPFPFDEIEAPQFVMEVRWTLSELCGYIRTWSATAAYAEAIGRDPIVDLEAELSRRWGNAEERHLVRWPLFMRAGRV